MSYNPSSASRKRGQKRRQSVTQRRQKLDLKKSATVTEVWHNNEPLILIPFKVVPIKTCVCAYYQNKFPRGHLVIVPLATWLYFNDNRNRNADYFTHFILLHQLKSEPL